jgi:glutamine amidotransferase
MSGIALIDYGMGNLRSVEKALEAVGAQVTVTSDPAVVAASDGVLLPGVGAFGDAMRELDARGLVEITRQRAHEARSGGRPFLGICLGMQVLVEGGEEDPGVPGLGIFKGSCPRLDVPGLKVPHMGWNTLLWSQRANPLFDGLPDPSDVYFVHSFHVVPADPSIIAARVDYGGLVAASLRQANLFATQFHPEKSQRIGLRILENFSRLVQSAAGVRA